MLSAELRVFLSQPRNMRILLLTNFVFALAGPVIDLFISAYVMRNSHDVRLVMSYQMALFTGIPLAFLANGFLLRRFAIRHLYSFSMISSSAAMAAVMSLSKLEFGGIAATGLMMGLSIGMYWANRDFIALCSTHDGNRNYYYFLESFFGTLCGLVVPVSVGWFISGAEWYGWFGGDRNHAYYILNGVVFLLACAASVLICRGDFANPKPTRFLYWRFHPLWRRVLWMSVCRGLGQGFGTTAPTMLIMRLMGGKEGMLGALQTGGTLVAGIMVYLVGRFAHPRHRLGLLLIGLALCIAAAGSNALLFSAAGVITYFLLQTLGRPLIENTVSQVQLRAIDTLAQIESRNTFAYLFNNEFGLYAGRLFGGLLFIGIATFSETLALRYVLLAIGALQLLSYVFCRHILGQCKQLAPLPEEASFSEAPIARDQLEHGGGL